MNVRVVKVGGSLFDWPELPRRLRAWLDESPHPTLLVAGGGAAADQVREADRLWNFAADDAHDLALAAMNWNGRLLATMLKPHVAVRSLEAPEALDRWLDDSATANLDNRSSPVALADIAALLDDLERRAGRRLVERSWRVTSDSLAAWLAATLQTRGRATELVLLKSTGERSALVDKKTLADLARTGVVDECLSEYAAGIGRVRIVNLRAN